MSRFQWQKLVRAHLLSVLISWAVLGDAFHSPLRIAAATLAVAALFARFRWPAVALLVASAATWAAPAAVVLAVVVLAYGTARRLASGYWICATLGASWVLLSLGTLHHLNDGGGPPELVFAALVATALLTPTAAAGAVARARVRRLRDLEERNEILQWANRLGESQAKMAERARIANEMHDLIGHRLSLITLHAGALDMHTRQLAPELNEQAVLLRTTAKQALDELRTVLGLLSTDGADPASVGADAGTRTDVTALVTASRKAGSPVDMQWTGDDLIDVDRQIRTTVHRLVRESLTNVHKHAPGMPAHVRVERTDEAVTVAVSNRVEAPSPEPGTRLGLAGLGERVRLAGGTITSGLDAGRFEVRAVLPIAAPEEKRV